MGILKPIEDLWNINRAYVNSDVNLLCKKGYQLSDHSYWLTTEAQSGIHVDRQVTTQDIYYQDPYASKLMYELENNYIEMNNSLMSLNLGRCCIYMPLAWEPDKDWYADELYLENRLRK